MVRSGTVAGQKYRSSHDKSILKLQHNLRIRGEFNVNKNLYVVDLRLISGETQKSTTSLVKAVDSLTAERIALEGELHCDIGSGAEIHDDGYATDLYGE